MQSSVAFKPHSFKEFVFFKLVLPLLLARKKFLPQQNELMINIGGGHFFLPGWKVLDMNTEYYNFREGIIDYNYDLTSSSPFPFESESVKLFYSSHTLEHVQQKFSQHIFDEIYWCLKSGGGVRLTMPDFEKVKNAYLKNDKNFFDSYNGPIENAFLEWFSTYHARQLKSEEIRKKIVEMGIYEYANNLVNSIPDDYQKNNFGHCNWWNYDKASSALKKAGFEKIYKSAPQQSKFAEMRKTGRFFNSFDHKLPEISMYIEAVK